MKKTFLIICCVLIALSLCGCQNNVTEEVKGNTEEFIKVECPNGGVIEGGRLVYYDADPEKTPIFHEAVILNKERNYKESLDKILQALDAGEFDPLMYYYLGNDYYYGRGVEKDLDIAMEYFAKGREYKQPFCTYNLGVAYSNDIGDSDKAYELYDEALEQGESLAYCCYMGRDMIKDPELVESYTTKVIESNDPFAINIAGTTYLAYNRNSKKSFELFSLVASYGFAEGIRNLAIAYEKGYGTSKDPQKAYEYFMKAAETFEFSDYYIDVGYCYEYGVGVEKDADKAIEYYELSTKDGNGDGWFKIGYLYEYGKLVEKNYDKAMEYYLLGSNAKLPSEEAITRYKFLQNYTNNNK